jgi:diguanylate cyclase (GGDEF)-like protein
MILSCPMDSNLDVLLIESDPALAGLVANRLRANLVHVETLAAAQRALERQRFDAVLLNLSRGPRLLPAGTAARPLPAGAPAGDVQGPDPAPRLSGACGEHVAAVSPQGPNAVPGSAPSLRPRDSAGLAALRAIRDQAPDTAAVVLAEDEDSDLAVEAMQMGAQDVVAIPHMDAYPPLLGRALRYAVERQRILRIAAQVEGLRERERQLLILNEMGELLQICLHSEEAYSIVARTGRALFSNSIEIGGALAVLDMHGLARVVAAWGPSECAEEHFSRDRCWALRRGRAHLSLGTDAGLACGHHTPAEAPSLCVPLTGQGELLGVLSLVACGDAVPGAARLRELTPLATTFAEHMALALSNLRLHETLRGEAIRDPLTGLLNRRTMEEELGRELARAQRIEEPLGVVMMDLDLFKIYNDRHGHLAGDRLLSEMGRFLMAHTRGGDIACRYGGDEFLLILPGAGPDAVHERACQLRNGIRGLHADSPVTLSLGLAGFPEQGRSPAALLLAADTALYAAKRAGRDAVRKSAA